MRSGLFVFYCVCVYLKIVLCQPGEVCEAVDGGVGHCVSIYNCLPYLKLVQHSERNTLMNAKCGFEGIVPKVCCPSTTPSTTTSSIAPPTVVSASKSVAEDLMPALPGPPVCGLSNASFDRIVDGIDARLDDFPWMSLLGFRIKMSTVWGCGGALISTRHVLTAAHCIHNYESSLYVVRLGELDLAREDEATPIDILIKRMIKHEQYDANKGVNDVGILILNRDVTFTSSIRPICIPKDKDLISNNFEGYSPLVAGWGRTKCGGAPATHLQVIQLPVVSNDVCAHAYVQYKQMEFDQRLICAGFMRGGGYACKGDSGGPLMQPIWSVEDKKSYFYEIGLVSFGRRCVQPVIPGVYTRVTHFIPWIEEKVLGRGAC